LDKLKHIISPIDWAQFHFLHPRALWLFAPLALILFLLLAANTERRSWKEIISPHLRPFVFTRSSRRAFFFPLLLFVLGSACAILALAAPAWKKKEMPMQKIQAVVLIAIDCSGSMLATDLQPTRLERAKLKLVDFLDANPRAKAGLVAFAGTAHPVLPFTGDYKLVRQHASSLFPGVMPVAGTSAESLLGCIDSMMKPIVAPSSILLLTDAIDSRQANMLENYIRASRHHLEVLLFSTPGGALVPGHTGVLSRQDPTIVARLSQDSAVTVTPLTLDSSDIAGIAARIAGKLSFEKTAGENEKDWEDMGWVPLLAALLITLFWFRRGWVIQWCWLALAASTLQGCGLDAKHPDWWYSRDYQGQLLENKCRYEAAAERFDDDRYKAVAWYKAGNYEAAADLFDALPGADAAYNHGLALARLGRYEEALHAFDKAIHLDNSLEAKATASISRMKAAKQKQDSLLQFDNSKLAGKEKAFGDKKKKNDPLKERKAQSEDEQLSSDTRVSKLPSNGNRVTDETASNIHTAKEVRTPQLDSTLKKRSAAADNILMRQSAADPAEFLRRRFELQLKPYLKDLKKPKDPW
jgi:Ca-activated chloride channel family protein